MKKVILVLAMAFMAFTANAQLYVGGGISFNGQKNATVLGIAPEVGYNLSDDMAVGVGVGLAFADGQNAFSIEPYFRYYLVDLGPVRLFCDANFNFTSATINWGGTSTTDTTWGIGVLPGLAVNINDNWSVVSHFARLGYYAEAFDFQLNTQVVSLGVYYAF